MLKQIREALEQGMDQAARKDANTHDRRIKKEAEDLKRRRALLD